MSVSDYAAIAQAGAAIVALGLSTTAIVLPWLQQRRERDLKARFIATALRIELLNIAADLAKTTIPATTGTFTPALSGQLGAQFLQYQIPIPPLLSQCLDHAHLLGEPAGPTLLRLLAILKIYNEAVDRETTAGFVGPTVPAKDRWNNLLGFIRDVQPKVDEAIDQLSRIADKN